jgi:hypothetical protein
MQVPMSGNVLITILFTAGALDNVFHQKGEAMNTSAPS